MRWIHDKSCEEIWLCPKIYDKKGVPVSDRYSWNDIIKQKQLVVDQAWLRSLVKVFQGACATWKYNKKLSKVIEVKNMWNILKNWRIKSNIVWCQQKIHQEYLKIYFLLGKIRIENDDKFTPTQTHRSQNLPACVLYQG